MKHYTIIDSKNTNADDTIFNVIVDDAEGQAEFEADYPNASPGSTITVTGEDGAKSVLQKRHDGSYVEVKKNDSEGGGLPDVFWAKYEETTYDEVTAAVEAGKVVMVKIDGNQSFIQGSDPLPRYFMLAGKDSSEISGDFYTFYSIGMARLIVPTTARKIRNNAIRALVLYRSYYPTTNGWFEAEIAGGALITRDEYNPTSKTEQMTQPVGRDSNGILWTTPNPPLYNDIDGSTASDGATTPYAVNNAIANAMSGVSGAEVVSLLALVFWLNQQSDFQTLMASAVSSPQTWVNNSFMAPAEAVPISVVEKIVEAYTAKKSILLDLTDAAGGITPASVSVISDAALIVSWKTNAAQVTVDQGTGIATVTMFNLECSLVTSGAGGLLRVWLRMDYSEQIPPTTESE